MAKLMNMKFQKTALWKSLLSILIYLMHPCWIKDILHRVLTTRNATRNVGVHTRRDATPRRDRINQIAQPIKSVCERAFSGSSLHSQWNGRVYNLIHKYQTFLTSLNVHTEWLIPSLSWKTLVGSHCVLSFNGHVCLNLFSRSEVNYLLLLSVWL